MEKNLEINERKWTISVAIPSSIVDNAQTMELKSYLIGQIARTLVIFKIDEIIIYDDYCLSSYLSSNNNNNKTINVKKRNETIIQIIRILEYLDCPQYLRKKLFPIQKSLKYAGLLNPLEAPHHLNINEKFLYREGIVLDNNNNVNVKNDDGSFIDIGLKNYCFVRNKKLKSNIRVTVKINDNYLNNNKKFIHGKIVSPYEPREKYNIYWGYKIRLANSLSDVFKNCSFNNNNSNDNDYDLKIGTSDKGIDYRQILKTIPFKTSFRTLIVFGGLNGIEFAHKNDKNLFNKNETTSTLFDYYLNTCPDQGTDTIRTEEAILITLSTLQRYLYKKRNL